MDLTPEQEEEMLNNLAKKIQDYGFEMPATILFGSIQSFTEMFGQFGLFGAPFLEFFGIAGYDYASLFMKKGSVERLLKKIEEGAQTQK